MHSEYGKEKNREESVPPLTLYAVIEGELFFSFFRARYRRGKY